MEKNRLVAFSNGMLLRLSPESGKMEKAKFN